MSKPDEGAYPAGARRSQAERSEATRAALIEAARPLFAERGYAAVGTEEIVRAAGVTRGALYHHFDGKRELFEAVYVQIEAELGRADRERRARAPARRARSRRCGRAPRCSSRRAPFRRCSRSSSSTGPSVLGWDRWREIGAEHGLGLIEATLQAGDRRRGDRRAAGAAARPRADGRPRRGGDAGRPGRGPGGGAGRGRPHDRHPAGGAKRRRPGSPSACRRPLGGVPRSVRSRLRLELRTAVRCRARCHSFCAYMRTSASCIASREVPASAGIETEPQAALTSTPFLRVVSAIAASRVNPLEGLAVAGEDDAELVAADPVGGAGPGDDGIQPAAELGQQLVAGRVPAGVVVALEAVEVEEQDRDRLLLGRLGADALEVDLQGAAAARGRSAGRSAPVRAAACSPCR